MMFPISRRAGASGKRRPRRLGKLATYTVVRDTGGQWRIAAVQKTRHKPFTEAVSFLAQPVYSAGIAEMIAAMGPYGIPARAQRIALDSGPAHQIDRAARRGQSA